MNLLKSYLAKLHAQNKNRIDELYLDRFSKIDDYKRLEYIYSDLKFWFYGMSPRNPEKLVLNIEIPKELVFENVITDNVVAVEHYLLRYLYEDVNKINEEYFNKNKSTREKPYVESQKTNEIIIKRNGISFDFDKKVFNYRLLFFVPLINNAHINGKSTFKAIKEIMTVVSKKLEFISKEEFNRNIDIYLKQQEIRKYIKENGYVTFIANNSILPRSEGTNKPLENSINFTSPKSLEICIKLKDGNKILGMGIKKGITVITGGGYSGKTTLLEAIEMGVYNHECGDGREYCITDDTAMKICAEDGRYVTNTDISPFYKYIPSNEGIHNFSTQDASGSISQAVNIIEAINCNSKLLLIDEDRSATNFMIRDYNMHLVVKNDPIIPFTNRIKEIYRNYDVSTILVIGGSSVYLKYANCVLLLEEYVPKDITDFVKTLDLMKIMEEPVKANFITKRKIANFKLKEMFNYFNIVANDKSKKIVIDEYQADITFIETLLSDYQINYLAYIMQLIISRSEFLENDIIENVMVMNNILFNESIQQIVSQYNFKCDIWFEDVRKYDVISCINRLRGILFEFID